MASHTPRALVASTSSQTAWLVLSSGAMSSPMPAAPSAPSRRPKRAGDQLRGDVELRAWNPERTARDAPCELGSQRVQARVADCTMGRAGPFQTLASAPGTAQIRSMSELPIIERQVVRVVLLDALERVLLFHTRDLSEPEQGTWWELPGGGLEPGESHDEAAIRELEEEAGIFLEPSQLRAPGWRRSATFTYRGTRRINHEQVLGARLRVAGPDIDGRGRVDFENDDYFAFRWWPVAELMASRERFYPGRLPELLEKFLAGQAIDEPFERWS
jgi:8-oxo-dGTP pyrophosphatase MutT (NUDIX family)